MQGTHVPSLVWEDCTCLGASEPTSHNCRPPTVESRHLEEKPPSMRCPAQPKLKNRLWGRCGNRDPKGHGRNAFFFFASSATNTYETSKLSALMPWELGLYRPWRLLWLLCSSACPVYWWSFGKLAHEIITLQTQQIFPFLPHEHVYPVDQKWGG